MTELQEKILGLLEEIDQLCRENDVTYYLTASTLLGALRHKGFIPWDDDADVIMTRDNWNKFLERTRGKLPNDIVLNTQDDDPNLAMTANHFVDTSTAAIYRYDLTNPEVTGIFVDILIMDPVPDDPVAKEEYVNALTNHTELTTVPYQYSLRIGKPTRFNQYWAESKRKGKRSVLDEIDRIAFSYDEQTSDLYAQRFAGSPHFWPKEWYGTPKYVQFETIMLPIPQRAEDCLCVGFDDDWMYVPAGGNLKSTHDFCVRSLSIPGKVITDEFWQIVEQESMLNTYVKRKKIWVKNTENRFFQTTGRDSFVTARLQMTYDKKRKEEDFKSYLSDKNYELLEKYFNEYISVQCTSRFLGSSSLTGWTNWYRKCHPYLIDIGDEELYAVLILAFRRRHLTWVSRLIQARKDLNRPMTEQLLDAERLYKAVKDSNRYFSNGEWAQCRTVLNEFLPYWQDNPYLYVLDLQLKRKEGYKTVDLFDDIKTGLDLFPDDAELLEILADAYFDMERYDDAWQIYQQIVSTTCHGFVLMRMQERIEQLMVQSPSNRDLCALWLKIRTKRGESELPKLNELCPENIEKSPQNDEKNTEEECIANENQEDSVGNNESENELGEIAKEEDPLAHLTSIQRRRYNLLVELAEICDKNKIQYFLIGKALWMAARTGQYTDENADIVVAMNPKNCEKFVQAVTDENRQDRYIDSMYTNPYFHRFAVRYCDRNSLDITVSKCISGGEAKNQFGIFVTVEILRFPAKNKYADYLLRMLENGWEAYIGGKWNTKRQRISKCCVTALGAVAGKSRTAKLIYKLLMKYSQKKNGNKMFLKTYGKKRKYYPNYYFDFTKKVSFENHEFTTIKMSSAYLNSQYGKNWAKKLPHTKIDPSSRIVDADISGHDFVEYLDKKGNIRETYWKKFRKTESNYSPVAPLNKKIDHYWSIMCMCGERYRLFDKYMLMKSYIMELYKDNKIKLLKTLLDDYIKTAVTSAKEGVDISFDKQLSTVVDYVMFNSKQVKDAELLRKIRSKSPAPPINKNYREAFYKMREAQSKDIDAILNYLKSNVKDCIYMYIDIKKYGLSNPNMKIWIAADDGGINLVVMKYHTSISVYTKADKWDTAAVIDIIQQEKPESITATKEIIETLYTAIEEDYDVVYGSVFELTAYRPLEFDENIELATENDTREIAELITSNEEIGGYYEVDDLADQLAERMRTNMGRSYVIRDQGKIVAHIASYAECDGIATTGGLIVDSAYQTGVYGTVLEGYLTARLQEDNFQVYTFVTSRLRKLLLMSIGNTCVGEYGKMTSKN